MPSYRALKGMNYRPDGNLRKSEVRAEEGDVVDDLPDESIDDLLVYGDIEPTDADGRKRASALAKAIKQLMPDDDELVEGDLGGDE